MGLVSVLLLGFFFPAAPDPALGTAIESADVYEIALSAAVPLLPPSVQALLHTKREQVRRSAATGMDTGTESAKGWHFVQMDVAAALRTDRGELRAAAHAFPRDQEKAKALYEKCGVRNGPALPWIVEDRYQALVGSFRAADLDRLATDAGVLLHFAMDASLPFNTTAHPSVEILRQRFHHDLVRRARTRLEHEVRVSPDRLAPPGGPRDAIFDVLLDAHRSAMDIIDGEKEYRTQGNREDNDDGSAVTIPILENRIEEGALLAANLITAAWIKAGKPQWKLDSPAITPPAAPIPPPATAVGVFLGSRNSTVYHRATCSHAARVKPENRVTFETSAAAQSAGRTPCKTCKPDRDVKP